MPKTVHRSLRVICLAAMAASALIAQQQPGSQQRVVELFQQAQQAEQSQDYVKAVGFYQHIVKIDPTIAEVWANLGMALYHQQNDKEAITAFEHATSLKPSLLGPHLFEGKAYLDMGVAEKALAPLQSALAIDPNQIETLLALGDAYALAHKYVSAVSTLRKAATQDPGSEDIECRLAVTYLEWAAYAGLSLRTAGDSYGSLIAGEKLAAENPEQAEDAYRRALNSNPDLVEARLGLAYFLIDNHPSQTNLEASREQIDEAIRKVPGRPDVLAAAIRLAIAEGDVPQARTRLQGLMKSDAAFAAANMDTLTAALPSAKAQSLATEFNQTSAKSSAAPEGFSSRLATLERMKTGRHLTAIESSEFARAAWHLHRYDQALSELSARTHLSAEEQYWLYRTCAELGRQVLTSTVAAHPDSLRSHLLLADLALQQNKNTMAQSEYEVAIALRPDDPEIRLLFLQTLESGGDRDKAVDEAKLDASRFPANAKLSLEAGDLLLHLKGDAAAALPYLKHAIEIDPKPDKPHSDLADAFAELGQLDDAIKEISPVLGSDEDGTMHYRLAQWYRQNGQRDLAEKAMATFMQLRTAKQKKDHEASADAAALRR